METIDCLLSYQYVKNSLPKLCENGSICMHRTLHAKISKNNNGSQFLSSFIIPLNFLVYAGLVL